MATYWLIPSLAVFLLGTIHVLLVERHEWEDDEARTDTLVGLTVSSILWPLGAFILITGILERLCKRSS